MSTPITVLGVTSLWPTTGDTGYSAQAEQLQKLLASAVKPIEGLYNGSAPSGTGGVGNLAMDNDGNLTFNGSVVALSSTTTTSLVGQNGVTITGTTYVPIIGLGNITPTSVSITPSSTGTDALTINNAGKIRGDFASTIANGGRVFFQTTGTNGRTNIGVIPSGTGTDGTSDDTGFTAYNKSDVLNNTSSYIQMVITTSSTKISSGANGSGTQLPLLLQVRGGNTAVTINTNTTVTFASTVTVNSSSTASNSVALVIGNKGVIQGDFTTAFSTGTASRSYFQTNIANSRSQLTVVPNGSTATSSGFGAFNNFDGTNSAFSFIGINRTQTTIQSGSQGTGTTVPIVMQIGNTTAVTINTDTSVTFASTATVGNNSNLVLQGTGGIQFADGTIQTTRAYSGSQGYTGSAGAGFTGSAGSTGFTGSGGTGFTGSAGTGFTGSAGTNGATGFTGSLGFTGSAGSNGTTGFTGSAGNDGAAGFTGSLGFTGSAGVGFTGSAGNDGGTGFTGSTGVGFTGSAGNDGAAGFTGSLGFTGSTGVGFTGSAGNDGGTGFTGSAGTNGGTGFTGSTGYVGSQGTGITVLGTVSDYTNLPGYPSSYTGAAGDAYITVDTGNLWIWNGSAWNDAGQFVGPTGYTGSLGIGYNGITSTTTFQPGVNNPQVITASQSFGENGLHIGDYIKVTSTANTGDWIWGEITSYSGADITVSVGAWSNASGSSYADWTISLSGAQGVIGYTGSTGSTGFTGSAGNDGAAGFTGSAGNDGAAGFTGSAGTNGFTGSLGFTGSAGNDGAAGFTGSAGTNGFTGSLGFTGSVGSTGFTGSTGTQGVIGFTGSAGVGFTGSTGFTGSASTVAGFTGSVGSTGFTGSAGSGASAATPTVRGVVFGSDSGYGNQFIGANAGLNGGGSGGNTGIGCYSMPNLTAGASYNMAIGISSARTLTAGVFNAAIGASALYSNSVGSCNTAIGGGALDYATGDRNIGIGFQAGHGICAQSDNTVIGSLNAPGCVCTVLIGAGTCERIKVDDSGLYINGSAFSSGFTGSAGSNGFTGSTGVGFTGSTGFIGSTGFVGSVGNIGFTGSVGAASAIGYTGSAGAGSTILIDAPSPSWPAYMALTTSTTGEIGIVNVDTGLYYDTNVHRLNLENILVDGVAYIGVTSTATAFTTPVMIGKSSSSTYIQSALINGNSNGSADWVAYSDIGTDANYWVDMGFTGSAFNDANFTITGPNEGYLFAHGGPAGGTGNLVLATGGGGTADDIVFATGGFLTANEKARLVNSTGVLSVPNGLSSKYHTVTSTTVSTSTSSMVVGTIETDGNAIFSTPLFASRGVVPSEQMMALSSAYTMTSTTATQKIFGGTVAANGAITLQPGIYFFESQMYLTSMSATSGNAAYQLAGTAVLTNILMQVWGQDASAGATGAAMGGSFTVTTGTGVAMVTTATGPALSVTIKGTFKVTTAGTVIPSIKLLTASAAVVAAGSYFKITTIGNNLTQPFVGNWT